MVFLDFPRKNNIFESNPSLEVGETFVRALGPLRPHLRRFSNLPRLKIPTTLSIFLLKTALFCL
jgi:hypothetical protein